MREVGVHDDGECAGTEVESVNVGCTVCEQYSTIKGNKLTLVQACLLEVGVAFFSSDSRSDIQYAPPRISPQVA